MLHIPLASPVNDQDTIPWHFRVQSDLKINGEGDIHRMQAAHAHLCKIQVKYFNDEIIPDIIFSLQSTVPTSV